MRITSRRQFLKAAAVTTGGVLATRSMASWALPEIQLSIIPPLSVFGYPQVQLFDGLLRWQFDENHKIFLNLDEDGLLKPFRQRQGIPLPSQISVVGTTIATTSIPKKMISMASLL